MCHPRKVLQSFQSEKIFFEPADSYVSPLSKPRLISETAPFSFLDFVQLTFHSLDLSRFKSSVPLFSKPVNLIFP
ncbi:hypothetical protein L1887_09506 [Cichorium endivia]|nr:hypothetical protein L1887_09506 [Cichorium endivia]